MADFKLVGAVAIKVRPDASGFRKSTEKQVKKELAGYKADVKVDAKVNLDTTKAKADADKFEKEESGKTVNWKVKLDHDSVRDAMKRFDSLFEPTKKIKFDINDQGSIDKAQAKLDKMMRKAKVNITYSQDEQGYKEVLAKIDQIRRQKIEKTIKFKKDDASLDALEKEMKRKIAALGGSEFDIPAHSTVKLEYNENRAGLEAVLADIDRELSKFKDQTFYVSPDKPSLLAARAAVQEALDNTPAKVEITYNKNRASLEKAIAEIDAELAKVTSVKLNVHLTPTELIFAKAKLEAELGHQKVKLEYDNNEAGLQAAKAKLEALLHINKLHIETTLDEAALRAQLLWVDARIKEAERKKLRIETTLNPASYLKTFAAIKLLAKNQTVTIFTKMNNLGLLLAAAKLTGLRAASRWTEGFARSLGTLDRNLPIVAAAMVGLSTLSAGILTLTADVFSLGNGVGEVVRMAGLLAPAMILGLGASMIVLKGVFKDFGAAVNGDAKALKALAPAGREAAKGVRAVFQDIRQTTSKNFWDEASAGMLRFTKTALPAVGDGLGKLSTSLGGIFSRLLDSFSKLAQQGGIKVFFANLTHGFDLAQTGLSDFMDAFNTLGVVGSTIFPRMGRAFNDFASRFDAWVQRIAADGTLQRWIDIGIQGMHDLMDIAGSLGKIWGNVGQAAQAAGAMTLHSFAQALDRLDVITSGNRFQKNMKTIFEGAKQASETFHKALGNLGPAFDVFSVTVKHTLVNAAGALGAFIATVGDVISSPKVDVGLTAFLTGVKSLFTSLRPAAADVATILQTFGQILGKVATDSGPLFLNLFGQLSNVLSVAWAALEPFLPGLMQIGTNIINVLGPALALAAQSIIPAFADAVQRVGTGLTPVIALVADFAAGAAGLISSLPLPVLAGIATWVVSLGTAFAFANTVVPIAVGALKAFGVAAALTGIDIQLMVPVLGLFLAAASAVIAFGVTALATSQQSAAPYANEYAAALNEDAQAATNLADAVGNATTAVALHKLTDSGAFEAAQKLGIGTQEVTDAVLKGGPAWDAIQQKIIAANKTYDDSFAAAQKAVSGQQQFAGEMSKDGPNADMLAKRDAANALNKVLNEQKGSFDLATRQKKIYDDASKHAGISTIQETNAQKGLATQSGKTAQALGAAAAASTTLNDTFASSASKVDAMRKTFEILLPSNNVQKVAENLGAYAKGLNDIRDSAKTLRPEIDKLSNTDLFGKKNTGFLNIANGNKAVMQLNQSLIDEVNNVWAGAKGVYDQAIKHGDTAVSALKQAQQFVDDHKGDYDALAKASGVSADKVQGQWDAVFGHDWVLKVSLEGATEAAATAQALMASIGGKFDGKRFQAFLDANPDEAMKAITDAQGAAADFVNHEWKAKLDALPKPAQDKLRQLVGMTEEDWNKGDFQAILRAADKVPGLAEALLQINNGVNVPRYAHIFADLNTASALAVQIALNSLTMTRSVAIQVAYTQVGPGLSSFVPRGGQRVINANGNILNGRGIKQFANGGIERHVAQIQRAGGPVRIWAEPETGSEAYIPYASHKRPRSVAILSQVAKDFGYSLSRTEHFANGGVTGTASPSTHNTASVHIGTLHTTDPDEAVRKIRLSQMDALAVNGISLNGV